MSCVAKPLAHIRVTVRPDRRAHRSLRGPPSRALNALTFHPFGCHEARPHAWRKRLSWDGELLGALTRIFTDAVHAFYAQSHSGRSGSVTVTQRTSSDMRLNPHLHAIFPDGATVADAAIPTWEPLGHLQTTRFAILEGGRQVGEVLEKAVHRMVKLLTRRGLLVLAAENDQSRRNGASFLPDTFLVSCHRSSLE